VESLVSLRQIGRQEKLQRIERKKQGFKTQKEWQDFEREGNKVLLTQDELECLWIGASNDVQLIPEIHNAVPGDHQASGVSVPAKGLQEIPAFHQRIKEMEIPYGTG
jgi:hypothetical protein